MACSSDSFLRKLSIGEMSNLSGLATSTLRYYNKIKLLIPEFTDPYTGYRYYNQDQLYDVNFINSWKDFGFTLDEIIMIKETNKPEKIINSYIQMESQISIQRELLGQKLDTLIQKRQKMEQYLDKKSAQYLKNSPFQIVYREEMLIVSKSAQESDYGFLSYQISRNNLLKYIQKNEMQIVENFGSRFYCDDILNFEYCHHEFFFPILPNRNTEHLEVVPKGKYARGILSGNLDGLHDYLKEFVAWCNQNAYKVKNEMIFIYLIDTSITCNDNMFVTEILLPLQ